MKQAILVLGTCALLSLDPKPATAGDFGAWNDHAAPFSFRFGNEIDGHQQSRLTRGGSLIGFLYIQFTGTITKDGYRVATHGDCNAEPCAVGWAFNAKPVNATSLGHEMSDHPLFSMARSDIPQPGAFSHFHWLGDTPMTGVPSAGYLLELVAANRFCFIHHDAARATSAKTCRDNTGVKLDLGIDMASHLNIVASSIPHDM